MDEQRLIKLKVNQIHRNMASDSLYTVIFYVLPNLKKNIYIKYSFLKENCLQFGVDIDFY